MVVTFMSIAVLLVVVVVDRRLSICVRSQSHQFLCNASIDVRKVCVASQACDGFMQQGPD